MKKRICLLFMSVLIVNYAACQKAPEKSRYKDNFAFKDIYDDQADAKVDIAAAITRAQTDQKRILLMFGGNWCPWCQRLHHLFETNATIKDYLHTHFELVLVDLGKRDHNMDVDEKYGYPNKLGLPALVVLDSDGRQLCSQETGSLEFPKDHQLRGHDPEKVLQFLRSWSLAKD